MGFNKLEPTNLNKILDAKLSQPKELTGQEKRSKQQAFLVIRLLTTRRRLLIIGIGNDDPLIQSPIGWADEMYSNLRTFGMGKI